MNLLFIQIKVTFYLFDVLLFHLLELFYFFLETITFNNYFITIV